MPSWHQKLLLQRGKDERGFSKMSSSQHCYCLEMQLHRTWGGRDTICNIRKSWSAYCWSCHTYGLSWLRLNRRKKEFAEVRVQMEAAVPGGMRKRGGAKASGKGREVGHFPIAAMQLVIMVDEGGCCVFWFNYLQFLQVPLCTSCEDISAVTSVLPCGLIVYVGLFSLGLMYRTAALQWIRKRSCIPLFLG